MTAVPARDDDAAVSEAPAPEQAEEEEEGEEAELRRNGGRIATLIEELAALGGAPVRQRVGELIASLVSLYGAGLARVMDILASDGLDATMKARLAADPLVSSLLVLHGLLPDPDATADAPAYPRQPRSAEALGERLVQIDLARTRPVVKGNEP